MKLEKIALSNLAKIHNFYFHIVNKIFARSGRTFQVKIQNLAKCSNLLKNFCKIS